MAQVFTNMDALFLRMVAEGSEGQLDNNTRSRLLVIAENLQSLDDRVAALQSLPSTSGTYAEGYAAAEARMRARSNILSNPEGEDATGAAIIKQIDRLAAEGKVKRIALGERALDDKPDKFNAPYRKAKATSSLNIQLDLSDL